MMVLRIPAKRHHRSCRNNNVLLQLVRHLLDSCPAIDLAGTKHFSERTELSGKQYYRKKKTEVLAAIIRNYEGAFNENK